MLFYTFFYSYENNIICMKCNNKHFYNLSIIEYYKILIEQKKLREILNSNGKNIKLKNYNIICENCKKNNGGFCIQCQKDYCEECLQNHFSFSGYCRNNNNYLTIYYYQRYPEQNLIEEFEKYVENELNSISIIDNILNKVQNENKYEIILDNLEEVKLIFIFFKNIIYTFNSTKLNMAILENLIIIISLSRYSFNVLIKFIEKNKKSNELIEICNEIYSLFLQNIKAN